MTPEMHRRYAKEIKSAKLDEFKSYLDNGGFASGGQAQAIQGTLISLLVVGF